MKFFSDSDKFSKAVGKFISEQEIKPIFSLDFPFLEKQKKFTLLSIPDYNSHLKRSVLLLTKKEIYMCADAVPVVDKKKYGAILNKPYGESTIVSLVVLKSVLNNYLAEFTRLRGIMDTLDLQLDLEKIEETGRGLRKLTDRCEELVRLIISLKEKEINEIDTSLISFDYELLNTETRYLLERCRSHVYRISSLRTKSEMQSNRELNDTMHRLTIIVTFLTIVSIVVSVPGTIGAIFGIPALSDAYFRGHAPVLVLSLLVLTMASVVLGFWYWKSLNLKKN